LDGTQLQDELVDDYDCGDILQSLGGGRISFLLHFDEIDAWCPCDTLPASFYKLWNDHLQPILTNQYLVYCSGRSSHLYQIGKQLFHPEYVSPQNSAVVCLVLDTLRKEHIAAIFQRLAKKFFREEDFDEAMREIYESTGGVPRLIAFTIEYLLEKCTAPVEVQKLRELLPLLNWIKAEKGTEELAPYTRLEGAMRKLYFDCITIAALGLSVSLDTKLTIPEVTPEPTTALEFVKQLNLYVRRGEDEASFEIVFPKMVLMFHAYEPCVPQDKPWQVFLGSSYTTLPEDGSALELALQLCIARMLKLYLFYFFSFFLCYLIRCARFNERAKRTFGKIFPFLKPSFINSCLLELPDGPFRFPSLSSDDRLRLSHKNELRSYMHENLHVKKILKIHTSQGRKCRGLMQEGALYISPGMVSC
jgi:hypothetical protein